MSGRTPEDWTKNDRDRFFHLVKFFVWDDPCFFKYVLTKSLEGVSLTMRLEVSFHPVMTKHVGDISVVKRQQPKSFIVVFIGLLYLEILLTIERVALDANSWIILIDMI